MHHRHLNTTEWIPMAVESLYDRGEMADWQEFGIALSKDKHLAVTALQIAANHEDRGSAALARILVKRFHPQILATETDSGIGQLQALTFAKRF